mgnify:CR=1 FL=1
MSGAIETLAEIAAGAAASHPVAAVVVGATAVIGIVIIECVRMKYNNNQSKQSNQNQSGDADMGCGNKQGTAKQNYM